jgi:hypothetical protein
MRKKTKGRIFAYESELETSFDLVLRDADQLYQGQGRLKKTYDRLAKCLDDLDVSYSYKEAKAPESPESFRGRE